MNVHVQGNKALQSIFGSYFLFSLSVLQNFPQHSYSSRGFLPQLPQRYVMVILYFILTCFWSCITGASCAFYNYTQAYVVWLHYSLYTFWNHILLCIVSLFFVSEIIFCKIKNKSFTFHYCALQFFFLYIFCSILTSQ